MDIPVVHPPVEITNLTAAGLEASLAPHLEGAAAGVVVDLSEVTFVSSGGLGTLVRAGQRLGARGAPLVLAAGRRRIVRLFQTVGLDHLLPLFDSVEAARAWVSERPVRGAPE